MTTYGPNIENLNLIHAKAAGKKDGVYTFRGLYYLVREGKFTHYTYNGQVVERCGSFNVTIGQHPQYGEKKTLNSLHPQKEK